MRTRYSSYILALVCTTRLAVQAQEPLIPLWTHVDPYGAGGLFCCNDVFSTRVAYDQGTDRIYRSIFVYSLYGGHKVQVFDPDGNDISPPSPVVLQGIAIGDYQATQILQLSATNDTLSAIVRGDVLFSEADDLNWLKVLGTDGSPYYLVGSGSVPLNAFHRDATGTWILADDELRRYGPTGWPDGSIAVTQAGGMAVLGNDAVLGAPPSISRIDRTTLTSLPPIVVPSTGTATSGICIANGISAFNYAAVNSNGTMDVGLADINSGPIWSTTISIPAEAQPTAYHVDEQGDLWIAVAYNATDMASLGLLYRFHLSGSPYGVNSFSRRIDGIASSDGRLFLTGRVMGSMSDTYLAAFDTDLITGTPADATETFHIYPDPATDILRIDGLGPTTQRAEITDAVGRHLSELKGPFTGSTSISVSDLTPGTYFLRVSAVDRVMTQPFHVVH